MRIVEPLLWLSILAAVAGCAGTRPAVPDPATPPVAATSLEGAVADLAKLVTGASSGPRRLGVMPFEAPRGAGEIAPRATDRATACAVAAGLSVFDRTWAEALAVASAGKPPVAAADLAVALDWSAVLTGALRDDAGRRLDLTLLEPATGRVLGRRAVALPAGGLPAMTGPTGAASCPATLVERPPPPGLRARGDPQIFTDLAPGIAIDRRAFVERRKKDGGFEPPTEWDGAPLSAGDHIAFYFVPRVGCRLAIVSFETDGGIRHLYPQAGAAPTGRVAADTLVKIPPGERQWFALRAPAGEDRIVLYAELGDGGLVDAALPKAATASAVERLKTETDAALEQSAADMRMRSAFRRIRAGAPARGDGVWPRNLVEEEGGTIDIEGTAATKPFRLGRVEGTRRVIEEFRVRHR